MQQVRKARPRKSASGPKSAASAALDGGIVDFTALDGLVGFLVRMIQVRLFQKFHERFAGTGMSPGAFSALVAIGANPRVRSGTLGDALLIKRSNMSKLVYSIERRGLVRRFASDVDKRSVELALTDAGRARIAGMMPAVLEHEAVALASLSVHECRVLTGLLGKLNEGMRGPPSG